MPITPSLIIPAACSMVILLVTLTGCRSTGASVQASSPPTLAQIAGAWDMDLSPKQDGTYLKDLIITPNISKPDAGTFTGIVYGNSPYDNGVSLINSTSHTFIFVSDEAGTLGGPYHWIGTASPSGNELSGRVQCLSRNLLMPWKAKRKAANFTS